MEERAFSVGHSGECKFTVVSHVRISRCTARPCITTPPQVRGMGALGVNGPKSRSHVGAHIASARLPIHWARLDRTRRRSSSLSSSTRLSPKPQRPTPSHPSTTMPENGETAPLLGENIPNLARNANAPPDNTRRAATVRAITYGVLTTAFVVALVLFLFLWDTFTGIGPLPKDPHKAALIVLKNAPVIVSTIPR